MTIFVYPLENILGALQRQRKLIITLFYLIIGNVLRTVIRDCRRLYQNIGLRQLILNSRQHIRRRNHAPNVHEVRRRKLRHAAYQRYLRAAQH